MRDVELYQQLLGLVAPWTVGRVELSVEGERVDIWAEHAPEVRWPCPECATLLSVGGRYERLVGDAKDSPVVAQRGDSNQWIGGVGVAYLFK